MRTGLKDYLIVVGFMTLLLFMMMGMPALLLTWTTP